MNVVITGANGFLGGHVTEGLKKKHNVTCLARKDIRVSGANVVVFHSYREKIIADTLKNADVLIHIAAQLHGPMDEMMESNVAFTKHLVELARSSGVKYFIYVSTENVSQGNQDIYSMTKALAEKEVAAFSPSLVIRPTIIYGPGDSKYVGRLVNIIKKYPFVPILGNGKSKFQFVYAGDLVKVIDFGIDHFVTGTYTIAGPESISYNQFMQLLMKSMKTKKRLIHFPLWMLRPAAHIFNLLFRKPPLTPTQLDNLLKDRSYDTGLQTETFHYQPTSLDSGLEKTLHPVS